MATLRFPLALAALTIALPAFAQAPSQSPDQTKPTPPAQSVTPAPSPSASTPSSGSFMTEMKPGVWRAAKLNGVNVYNAQNEKIGDINDVLIDQSGKAQAVVIGVGGFLGMGEHDVAIPFDQIKFSDEPLRTASSSTSSSSTSSSTATAPRATDKSDVTGTTRATTDNRRGYPDHALLNMTKEQLKAAPQFKYPSSTGSNR
jgi:sporulation protein YlmC with PRC-barrel domain